MEVTRIYKNSSDEYLRIDTIYMEPTCSGLSRSKEEFTYRRKLSTQLLYETTDRVISVINLITDGDIVDYNPSVTGDYTYVKWTLGTKTVECNMSDLPGVGDTV